MDSCPKFVTNPIARLDAYLGDMRIDQGREDKHTLRRQFCVSVNVAEVATIRCVDNYFAFWFFLEARKIEILVRSPTLVAFVL